MLLGTDKPLTNDPMEATYIGVHMWAQAVKKAGSTDTDKVIAAMAGQTFPTPGGFVSRRPPSCALNSAVPPWLLQPLSVASAGAVPSLKLSLSAHQSLTAP